MTRLLPALAVPALASVIVATAIGATSGNTTSARYSPSAGLARTTPNSAIGARRTSLGRTLVDARGRTLYLFEADRANVSNCSSACLSVWPALTARARPRATGAAIASKIGTIRVRGGRQVTYAHHPLYYYVGDRKPGDVNGEGLTQFGATWYALSPAGRGIDDD